MALITAATMITYQLLHIHRAHSRSMRSVIDKYVKAWQAHYAN